MSFSTGSNQATNISGAADPNTTGGHSVSSGRRMISNIGVEDACGVMWQWGLAFGGPYAGSTMVDQFAATRTTQRGQGGYMPNGVFLGGAWSLGVSCGSRGSQWSVGPTFLSALCGARGVSEPSTII